MKKTLAALLIALWLLTGTTALCADYRVADENAANFAGLLQTLVYAYETPSPDDGQAIEAGLDAIRSVSESDYEIARAIADHWRRVYLDAGYRLLVYTGGERAEALEQSTLEDNDEHALVVLGYELKDGEMTDELIGRCEAAAAAARSFPSAIIVCSGGATGENNPDNHTEAGMMKDYLVNRCGIDAARIHIDERAMSTVDNALNTFVILRENDIETMTIITSTYHQRWGQAIYNAVGAIYRQLYGYSAEIVENFCFEIEPSDEMLKMDDRIAARQLASVLNLPKELLNGGRP